MTDPDEISPEKRAATFARWEKLDLEKIRADLENGGYQLIGSAPQVRELAREFVRMKDAEKANVPKELFSLKPTPHGFGIDLLEAGRRIQRLLRQAFRRP
jgi:hypothetical protein